MMTRFLVSALLCLFAAAPSWAAPPAAFGRPLSGMPTPAFVQDDPQPVHAAAVEHTDGYQTRAKIHKIASFATLPLFAAELALGVLTGRERAQALAHLDHCPSCREEVRQLTATGEGLLGLLPSVEPPAGFEARVMDRLGLSAPAPSPDRRASWIRIEPTPPAPPAINRVRGSMLLPG